MRFLSIGLVHETNTFAATPTRLADFVAASGGDPAFPPADIVARFAGTATIHGGYLEEAQARGIALEPLFHAQATPGGVVEQSAYDRLKAEILARLQRALPADGILLDLHGAMVTEAHDDAEGDLAGSVRQLAGPTVPVVLTLDLHANVTARMAAAVDALVGFDTYPHIDMQDRGREAVALLARTVAGQVRPTMAFRPLPLLTLPPRQCTLRQPMRGILAYLHGLERRPGVLTATVALGFPFADIRDAGVSAVVVTDNDPALAELEVGALARRIWSDRQAFTPELTPVEEAIRYAQQEAHGPVILADGSDNPGGGAPCDGTVILRKLLASRVTGAVVGVLADAQTVDQAHRAGVGQTMDVRLGGKTDDRHGDPVAGRAYVKVLADGVFTYHGPMGRGTRGHLGRMAVLVLDGVEVVVAERREQLRDREMLRMVGIEPAQKRLIVVKSAVHFRADFSEIADRIFDADTPGIHRPDFAGYPYRKLRRPIYPLDDAADEGGLV